MKRLALAFIAVAIAVGAAVGAGYFPNFPLVGGAAYCASFVTGTTGQICGQTVPAGPAGLAGTEYIIADLSPSASIGQQPATVSVPLGLFSGGSPLRYLTASANTFAMSPQDGGVFFIGTGTLNGAAVVTLPAALYDGQQFRASANVIMNNVTFNVPTGYSLTNAPNGITPVTTLAPITPTNSGGATMGYLWVFSRAAGAGNTWYRFQ